MQLYTVLSAVLLLASSGLASPAPKKGTFKTFKLPNATSGPCDLCTGPDNAIWVSNILKNTVARVDPHTGHIDEYPIPYEGSASPLSSLPIVADGVTALACAIRTGTDGNIYAATGVRNQLVKIEMPARKVSVIKQPSVNPFGNLENFNDLWTGPKGMFVSHTTGGVISYYHYKKGHFQNFAVPNPLSLPLGLIVSKYDGALWFTELTGNKIGRLNFTSGDIKEYPLPLPLQTPSVMRVEIGHYLWFVTISGNGLGRIDQRTGKIKLFQDPDPLVVPGEIAKDFQDNVWYSTFARDSLNRYTPKTGKFKRYPLPGPNVIDSRLPPDIPVPVHHHTSTNTMWFTKAALNEVGYLVL